MLRLLSKLFGKKAAERHKSRVAPPAKEELEKKIGYIFANAYYLSEALTHRSSLRPNEPYPARSYERLEFLGDSVLGLIVAEELFHEYPQMSEGQLTKSKSLLVNKKVLAHAGNRIGLGKYIFMSSEEERAGGRERQSIVADCFEAIIGAVYLDGGMDAARAVIRKLLSFDFDQVSLTLSLRNFKGELLERLQASGAGSPRYTVTSEDGPEHCKTFTVEVYIDGKQMGRGKGNSKKSAEQKAAENALLALQSQK